MVRLALVTSVMWRPPSGPPVRCQMSHESVGAEQGVPGLGPGAQPRDVLQQPGELSGREVRRDGEPGALPDQCFVTGPAPLGAELIGPGVLPHDGVGQGAAGVAVPHHGGLPLVGHPQGGQIAGHAGRAGSSPSPPRFGCGPRSPARCVPPTPGRAGSADARADAGPPHGRRGRRPCSGWRWCSGRWLRRTWPCPLLSSAPRGTLGHQTRRPGGLAGGAEGPVSVAAPRLSTCSSTCTPTAGPRTGTQTPAELVAEGRRPGAVGARPDRSRHHRRLGGGRSRSPARPDHPGPGDRSLLPARRHQPARAVLPARSRRSAAARRTGASASESTTAGAADRRPAC
jgi:hypothetical protein